MEREVWTIVPFLLDMKGLLYGCWSCLSSFIIVPFTFFALDLPWSNMTLRLCLVLGKLDGKEKKRKICFFPLFGLKKFWKKKIDGKVHGNNTTTTPSQCGSRFPVVSRDPNVGNLISTSLVVVERLIPKDPQNKILWKHFVEEGFYENILWRGKVHGKFNKFVKKYFPSKSGCKAWGKWFPWNLWLLLSGQRFWTIEPWSPNDLENPHCR